MLYLPRELMPLAAESVRARLLAALGDFYAYIVVDSALPLALGDHYDIKADFSFHKETGEVVARVTVCNADGVDVFCVSL